MPDSELIRAARKRVGESQEEFAKRFGVDQTTIHRWETEGVPARGPTRMTIERVLADLPTAGSPGFAQ